MNAYRLRILLYGLEQFHGERSTSGLYHLLKGKKSSQTIQDGKLFGVSLLFRTMPRLKRKSFDEDLAYLVKHQYVEQGDLPEGFLLLTKAGKAEVKRFLQSDVFPHGLDGWGCDPLIRPFWNRFSLLVQSVSNLMNGTAQFIPVSKDESLFKWVKDWFISVGYSKAELADSFYWECRQLLGALPELQAKAIVLRLSAAHRYGLTFSQIGAELSEDEDAALYLFQAGIHQILHNVQGNPKLYPLLSTLIRDVQTQVPLTVSTRKTYQLWERGFSFEKIARIRSLKESTIEDHFVEIALNDPAFSIQSFVSKELQQMILSVYKTTKTKRIKPIKEAIEADVSYFQIRLVLAKGERI
ncbi:helix-turn-helix domain-containing protein [Bacillus tianshenii]|nr:helix-turn-helix domain-containing protein [Bacillus tianshenii]